MSSRLQVGTGEVMQGKKLPQSGDNENKGGMIGAFANSDVYVVVLPRQSMLS